MRSFFWPTGDLVADRECELPPSLQHHLNRVLRLPPGEKIRLFDGSGRVAEGFLISSDKVRVDHLNMVPEPICRIHLIQGLAKGDKTELILQKGTELGAAGFHLVTMNRSVARLKDHSGQYQRWMKIIQEAARQSGQYRLPRLVCADSLAVALGQKADLKLMLWEESRVPLADVVSGARPKSISVLVGPEGGITREEAAEAEAQGYRSVGFGPRILRTETAGLAILAVLQYLYGDLSDGPG